MGGASALLLVIVAPVVWHGAPLADDYDLCVRPAALGGLDAFLQVIWQEFGAVRPARFIEVTLVHALCGRVPFGVLLLVPLVLKFLTAWLLFLLLRDLRLPDPWPAAGTALWLLEPLGTEAALWPAALHIHLGLALVLAALLAARRGRYWLAGLAAVGACLSVEQVIFALPLTFVLFTPPERRRQSGLIALAVAIGVLILYALFPGDNVRQAMSLADRVAAVVKDPRWYIAYPATGLGLHSGALALWWALPWSLLALAGGAAAGAAAGPRLLRPAPDRPPLEAAALRRWAVRIVVLVGLVNLPLLVTEVGHSARTFTPTWLVLCGVAAAGGAAARWRRPRRSGGVIGALVAVAVLSLTLSAWVRVETVRFDEASAVWLAEQTEDGDVIALCDVPRTVVEPAPLGSFHLHAYHFQWDGVLRYHAGRSAELRRSSERYWGARCPDLEGADLVLDFDELLDAARSR